MRKNKPNRKIILMLSAVLVLAAVFVFLLAPASPAHKYAVYYSSKAYTLVKNTRASKWLTAHLSDKPAANLTLWDGSSDPVLGSMKVSERDGMFSIFIPAGTFLMGSGDEQALSLEKPQRLFYLDAYWIDQVPVTNAMYRQCMQAGVCRQPALLYQDFEDPQYDDYPMVYVTWDAADEYCRWVGGKLPGEAQWEKAARGTDGRAYPWGDQKPDVYLLNFNNNIGTTSKVGSYPDGASPYGVLDMAGNVREWVDDWFSENFLSEAPDENPSGPPEGIYKVLKSGAYSDGRDIVRSTTRIMHVPDSPGLNRGFRCVR